MKNFIGVVYMATTLFITSTKAHSMFGHTAEERQRRTATEQQLSQEQQCLDTQQHLTVEQQQRANHWQMTASALGIATVIALIVGTAIGSRGKDHANAGK